MDVDGVDILRAPDDDTGALATRRDIKVDEACVVTGEDVFAAHVDTGETTNPCAVEARARKAVTAIDFIFASVVCKKAGELLLGRSNACIAHHATHVVIGRHVLIGGRENISGAPAQQLSTNRCISYDVADKLKREMESERQHRTVQRLRAAHSRDRKGETQSSR